jgi:hypothetical protein
MQHATCDKQKEAGVWSAQCRAPTSDGRHDASSSWSTPARQLTVHSLHLDVCGEGHAAAGPTLTVHTGTEAGRRQPITLVPKLAMEQVCIEIQVHSRHRHVPEASGAENEARIQRHRPLCAPLIRVGDRGHTLSTNSTLGANKQRVPCNQYLPVAAREGGAWSTAGRGAQAQGAPIPSTWARQARRGPSAVLTVCAHPTQGIDIGTEGGRLGNQAS